MDMNGKQAEHNYCTLKWTSIQIFHFCLNKKKTNLKFNEKAYFCLHQILLMQNKCRKTVILMS